MAIYALGELEPDIHPEAYVHPDAVVIGDVVIGAESSVWPCAVLRGDTDRITVGARTSVQDGAVIHVGTGVPTTVGDEAVIGHLVHLEGCVVDDRALIGNGAVVLHRAHVGTGAIVGSNAVVPAGMEIPPHSMALGIPARLRENSVDTEALRFAFESYVARAKRFRDDLRRLD